MFFSKSFIVPGLIIWCLIHFELIFTYLVGNLSFLFCKLPFVSHVYFSKFFFLIYFLTLFVLYFCHLCYRYFSHFIFKDDEKTKVLKNLQRLLQNHMANAAVIKV